VVFEADCDKIKLQKMSYDVIFVASSSLRQSIDVTKITSQKVSILDLPSIKIFMRKLFIKNAVPRTNYTQLRQLRSLKESQPAPERSRGCISFNSIFIDKKGAFVSFIDLNY